jgi:cytochrome P450
MSQKPPARDPFRFLLNLLAREGDVARYRAGSESAFLVNHPDLIKHVLADNSQNYSNDTQISKMFKTEVADGLLTSEGALWRRRRRMIQPGFNHERLIGLAAEMTDATGRMLKRWEALGENDRVIDVAAEMSSLTMSIIARTLFGFDVSSHADRLGRQIGEGLKALLSPHSPEVQTPRRELEALVRQRIEERQGEAGRGPDGADDLLDLLLEARDEEMGRPLSIEELRDEMITLILAGYGTTANALAWTWYLLARNPESARRHRTELAEVLGDRTAEVKDLARLPYNRMVFEESLRLYPPAWILGRRALHDDNLAGHHIPAGSVVAISPYTMHRHPSFWDEPERFEPERFTLERSANRKPFAWLPFGGGPRLCIGHNFAMMEAQLIMATVAQRYRLQLTPGQDVVPERLFVLRPRGGLPMTVDEAS